MSKGVSLMTLAVFLHSLASTSSATGSSSCDAELAAAWRFSSYAPYALTMSALFSLVGMAAIIITSRMKPNDSSTHAVSVGIPPTPAVARPDSSALPCTDGAAPRLDQLTSRAAMPHAPPSVDATASPLEAGSLSKSEETGTLEAPSSDCVASALALVQRVRNLGLHLGEVVVSGVSIGLPNAETGRAVFDSENMNALMRGENFIGSLPEHLLHAQLDRNVVQVLKGPSGQRERRPLTALGEVIQLASRLGRFDLQTEYGLAPAIVETLDTTYALAIAAGLEALRDCGLIQPPLVACSSPLTSRAAAVPGTPATATGQGGPGWRLRHEHRDETGVIFAASFPALDSLIDELARAMAVQLKGAHTRARREWIDELSAMVRRRSREAHAAATGEEVLPGHTGEHASACEATECDGCLADLRHWLDEQKTQVAEEDSSADTYEFNRKLLFKVLVMANSQLAEIVQVRCSVALPPAP